jgi:Cd2+/Zn2+-exporting ATPase
MKLEFKICGMDCAEEVDILKREVGPLAGGEENLAFNLLAGKMIVEPADAAVTPGQIQSAVKSAGMEAIDWEEFSKKGARQPHEAFWAAHGRTVMTIASFIFLLGGFLWHWHVAGFIGALMEEGALPLHSIVLYAAAVVAGGWFIVPKALLAARRLRPDMNLLMTIAVIGAIFLGVWFEAATVAFLFSLALLMEAWSVGRARRAISELLDLTPPRARYICPHDGNIEEKPVDEIPIGATVIVRPGERIPLDGILTKGATSVNQAPITGESMPAVKEPGDEVFAGTINEEGAFEFQVTRAANNTTLARIIHMVEEAQARRSPSERWVEQFARYYTPLMIALAVAVFIAPPLLFGASWTAWFYNALVLLVIACPCALVISTPVSIVAALASAARAGVLIKGGLFVEIPARLKAVAVDKTGTLTHGHPEVQEIVPLNGHTVEELLERAATVESLSEHPLARAILRKAKSLGVAHGRAAAYRAVRGKGAEAVVHGRRFWVGNHRYAHEVQMDTPDTHARAEALEDAGHSVVFIGNDDHICGLISIVDPVREHAAPAVHRLREAGLDVIMLTGDNDGTARAVAAAVGIDHYRSELLPEDKLAAIEDIRDRHGMVAMVGDGINDAPAMAAANLGVAMGAAASAAAMETADVALMSDDLTKLAWLRRHAARTGRIIRQNVTLALGLKAIFIVLALLGLATLWMAIAADMGATMLVIFNGLRLLRQ